MLTKIISPFTGRHKDKTVAAPVMSGPLKRNAHPELSGLEIRAARIGGSRSTFPTIRRVKMWMRKQKTPAHVGKKQLAKIAARASAP